LRLLYFDCFSGAAGDMILGALLDAGLPLGELRGALETLLPPGSDIMAERVTRGGVAATKFRLIEHEHDRPGTAADRQTHVHPLDHPHGDHDHDRHDDQHRPHSHDHDHHHEREHAHRTVADIHALIHDSRLPARVKQRAATLFDRLAGAEAAVHQIPVERVHLHEVGALDSIVDVVGTVFGIDWFRADRIVSSPLNVGGGTVRCAHGVLPVPAPATLRLLQGMPIYSSGVEVELLTPSGALLVAGHATSFGPMPAMTVERAGYGAGDRELPGRPNVVRVLVGEAAADSRTEPLVVLECEIDDMNPQLFGLLMDRLHAAGALDVFFTPVQMKKNRPGTLVTVLSPPDRRERLSTIIFGETTTIGLRSHVAERERLDREIVKVETPHGTVRMKVARRSGAVVNAAPEFDDCAQLASVAGISVKEAQALAMKAYLDRVRDSVPDSAQNLKQFAEKPGFATENTEDTEKD